MEEQLCQGGELENVRDVASKIADNAARLAALLHVAQDRQGPIGADVMEQAADLALWHLYEARRMFGMGSGHIVDADTQKLDAWLIANSHNIVEPFTKSRILKFGPSGTRSGSKLKAALAQLESLGRVRCIQDSSRSLQIYVNPALVREAP